MSSSTDVAWARSAPVQAALAAVGESDGSPEWTLAFAEQILAEVDRTEELDIGDMLDAVSTWNWHLDRKFAHFLAPRQSLNALLGMPSSIPRMLLTRRVAGRVMDFEHCAWLLQVTVPELELLLWPRSLDALKADAERVLNGERIVEVRAGNGNAVQPLRDFIRIRHGYEVPGGRRVRPHQIDMAIRWMDEEGLSITGAHARLIELGEIEPDVGYTTIRQRIARARGKAQPPSAPGGAWSAA